MPAAFNAAIAYANLADAATLTASSAIPLAPVARLKGPHIARKWRSTGNAEAVIADLGAAKSLDTLALMGLNLTAAGTARVRASNADPTVTASLTYDSGVLPAGIVDPRYGMLVHLLGAAVSARYWRIDLADASLGYIEAGRLFIGPRNPFAYNFSPGWSRSYVDRSRRTESRGGQTYVDPGECYRTVSLTFDWITEAERNSFVEEIDRLNGTKTDVLLITRGDSPNLGRDSLWGLVADLDPIGQPQLVWEGGAPLYQKSYRINERL